MESVVYTKKIRVFDFPSLNITATYFPGISVSIYKIETKSHAKWKEHHETKISHWNAFF